MTTQEISYEAAKESVDTFKTYALIALGLGHNIELYGPAAHLADESTSTHRVATREIMIHSRITSSGDIHVSTIQSLVLWFQALRLEPTEIRMVVDNKQRMVCSAETVRVWAAGETELLTSEKYKQLHESQERIYRRASIIR